MELIDFLRARLDEDETAAKDAGGKSWAWEQHYGDMCNDPTCEYGELSTDDTVLMNVHAYDIRSAWQGASHIARHNPARILAEVEAKRLILDKIAPKMNEMDDAIDGEWGVGEGPSEYASEALLRILARPYRDHPDFDSSWVEA